MSVDPLVDAGIIWETASSAGSSSGSVDKDMFLQLFITQVQHQDPLNPISDTEFTSQLAQFTMIEELANANDLLAGLQVLETMSTNAQLTNFIGKDVKALGNQLKLHGDDAVIPGGDAEDAHGDEDRVVLMHFDLDAPAQDVTITIKDDSGTPVRVIELQILDEGEHEVGWDGKGDESQVLPAGNYTFSVTAEGAGEDDPDIQVTELIKGLVTGVTFEAGQTLLEVAEDYYISLADILSLNYVEEPEEGGDAGGVEP